MEIRTEKSSSCAKCMLKSICLPAVLSPNEYLQFQKIKKKSIILHAKKNIYSPNDPLKNLYILQSGSAKNYTISENGEEKITDFYFPGDILGMESICANSYVSHAITLQISSLCVIPVKNLVMLGNQLPTLHYQIIKLISRRLAAHIAMHSYYHADEKVAFFLVQLADRFNSLGYSPSEYYLSMSRQDIGNYLGLATETVSRIFSHFQKKKLLEIQNRHVLLHKEQLSHICH